MIRIIGVKKVIAVEMEDVAVITMNSGVSRSFPVFPSTIFMLVIVHCNVQVPVKRNNDYPNF